MKWRRMVLMATAGLVMSAGLSCPAPATAEQVFGPEQKITVRGTVPELRMIVVDEQERIRLVTSNTPNDVAPEVHLISITGATIPLSNDVRRQYESLMRQVSDDKAVTITPAPVPLAELFPIFTERRINTLYLVTPGRAGLAPYWITASE